MFCTSCGTKNGDDANFCKQCGSKLDRPTSGRISEHDYEKAMPEDDQVSTLLERAYRARKDGDRAGAIALCLEALKVRPQSTSCHSLLGQLYEQGGEHELAIEQYEQVLALNPGSIADRVKLDELRGDVPSIVTGRPHIVLADRSKDNPRVDYRTPTMVLAGVALMVLGGIFTMEMLANRSAAQRPGSDTSRNVISPATGPGTTQPGGNSVASANAAQTQPYNESAWQYNPLNGLAAGPPIIVQQAGTQPLGGQSATRNMGQTGSGNANGVAPIGPPDDKDIGADHVHMSTQNGSNTFDDGPQDPTPTKPKPEPKITVHNDPGKGSSGAQPSSPVTSGSDSQKNTGIADLLAQQGQYKQAGDTYLHALNGAGDDTAYIYRRAGWCFEKAGEKATAVSYYQKGIEAAQQLITSGQQVDIAKGIIRECQSGIKACTN